MIPRLEAADLPTLHTERLVLRPFRADDAPAVERIVGRFEIADTTLNIPHPYPAGAGAAWIATHGDAWRGERRVTLAVAFSHAPTEIVAAVGLGTDLAHGNAELGYWVAVEHWGRGIATEASRALLEFGFRDLALHRTHARHLARNTASGRVMQKIGMRREGTMRGALRKWGRFEDAVLYAVLAEDRAHGEGTAPPTDAALLQLQRMAEHGAWADAIVLAALEVAAERAPPDALREHAHVLGAQEVWLSRLEGRPSRTAVWPELTRAELGPLARSLREGWAMHVARLTADGLARDVTYTNSAGHTFTSTAGDILLHVALHGHYHRGRINLLLRQAALAPAPADFIAFARGAPAATTPRDPALER